ncbi:hypothetical protein [Achromobacter insolitus]|uniref:hypothetical protein n=1 Tax=Achromobacter insolitus TaxID=217204 RepID=UPI0013AE9A06|nr:hypothetical protein [Achromobacter insolitus]
MSRFTRERGALAKDDRLDAVTMAGAYWVEQMDKDTQKVQDEHREQMMAEELSKFATQVFGYSPPSDNWGEAWH